MAGTVPTSICAVGIDTAIGAPHAGASCLQGIIAQIVPARPELLVPQGSGSGGSSDAAVGRSFPPTLFVHMAQRDPEWAQQIGEALDYCRCGRGWVPVWLSCWEGWTWRGCSTPLFCTGCARGKW